MSSAERSSAVLPFVDRSDAGITTVDPAAPERRRRSGWAPPHALRIHRRAAIAAGTLAVAVIGVAPLEARDLAALVVVPQRGQSAEQARRDRYECHNWAVDQSGATPLRAPPDDDRDDVRDRRVRKVITGAAVGALLGGLVRGARAEPGRRGDGEAADGAIGGAVLGAAAGAIAGRNDRGDTAARALPDDDYLRALEACLTGRGYLLSTAESETT